MDKKNHCKTYGVKNEKIVAKFGGTSLANVENIKRVCAIIKSDPRRRLVVVSAPGKRAPDDIKITDLLFEIFNLKEAGANYDKPFNEFAQRFYDIEKSFGIKTDIKETFEEFYEELVNHNVDFITSTGEYFMAKMMAAILGYEFVDLDKTHAIVFCKNGTVDLKKSATAFAPYKDKRVVIPGFYGVVSDGRRGTRVKTFSRGGSDITGAIIANLVDACVYENWTDVDGIYDKDPNKHKDAKKFDVVSYSEVETLARNGANVLHPDCIKFVRDKKIPIHLKNTFNPGGEGTVIK